jgi:hypothetical protein
MTSLTLGEAAADLDAGVAANGASNAATARVTTQPAAQLALAAASEVRVLGRSLLGCLELLRESQINGEENASELLTVT